MQYARGPKGDVCNEVGGVCTELTDLLEIEVPSMMASEGDRTGTHCSMSASSHVMTELWQCVPFDAGLMGYLR